MTNQEKFIQTFGIDVWQQMIVFSGIADQFREFWTGAYNEPSRRKGHWIIKDRYYHDTITAECSECGREVEIPTCMSELMYNGCPYCLADMRGDTE